MANWDFNTRHGIRAFVDEQELEVIRDTVGGNRLSVGRNALARDVLVESDRERAAAAGEQIRRAEQALSERAVVAAESQARFARLAFAISIVALIVSIGTAIAQIVWAK